MKIKLGLLNLLITGLILIAIVLSGLLIRDIGLQQLSQLENSIEEDWKTLQQDPSLGPILGQIKSLSLEAPASDPIAQAWVKYMWLHIPQNAAGHYHVELLILSDTETTGLAATVMVQIMDLRSGDLVADFARRHELRPNANSSSPSHLETMSN